MTTLIPSEDFEILVAALMMEAAGFVTQEKEILAGTALSLSLDHKTAFLHPDQLVHAIRSKFGPMVILADESPRGDRRIACSSEERTCPAWRAGVAFMTGQAGGGGPPAQPGGHGRRSR